MGYIYLIENDYNNQKYVGLTTRTVEERWKEHLTKISGPIDKAIKLHGKEHFTVTTLEQCPDQELDEREKYWISYYNSYIDGYNCTLGGRREGNVPGFYGQIKEQVKPLWESGYSQKEIANLLNITITTAHRYLLSSGITAEEIQNRRKVFVSKQKSKPLWQYDINKNLVKIWDSQISAVRELLLSKSMLERAIDQDKTYRDCYWRRNEWKDTLTE